MRMGNTANHSQGLIEPFELPPRVHIIPLGFEKARVYEPVERLNGDRVVLIVHNQDDLETNEFYQHATSKFESLGVPFDHERANIFDLYDSLSVIGEEISEQDDGELFVNVATGSKVTAIAGMIACMAFDATPYYVKGVYDGQDSPGANEIIRLPKYNIEAPEPEQIRMMEFINSRLEEDEAPTKGDLIERAEKQQLPFLFHHEVEDKGKYRLLDRAIIEPLQQAGYIYLKKSGRNKRVYLSDDGYDALRAFKSLV